MNPKFSRDARLGERVLFQVDAAGEPEDVRYGRISEAPVARPNATYSAEEWHARVVDDVDGDEYVLIEGYDRMETLR